MQNRGKYLWNVKVLYFLSFGPFLSKCTFFRLWHFVSPINSTFSVIVCTYKIHVSDEEFFTLRNHCYDNWKIGFFLISWQPFTSYRVSVFAVILVRMRENTDQNNSEYGHISRSDCWGDRFPHQIMQLINPNYPKKWSQTDKVYSIKIVRGASCVPITKVTDL